MVLYPIQLGQIFWTRDRRIAEVIRVSSDINYRDSTYAVELSLKNEVRTRLVWGDGEHIGKASFNDTCGYDLVELISTPVTVAAHEQLDLF